MDSFQAYTLSRRFTVICYFTKYIYILHICEISLFKGEAPPFEPGLPPMIFFHEKKKMY